MKVLLSIKPEYVEKIFRGEKRFEYRKKIFKKNVDTVVVYCTKPVGKIIGEFTIDKILKNSPESLWDYTHAYSGISKELFMQYFNNVQEGYALKIKDVILYDEPIDPRINFKNFIPPQSFMYIG